MTEKKGIIPNSFQTPNDHVDHAMQFLSGDEYKVLNFAVRHIFGWHDKVADRKGRISLTTFCDGFKTKSGEHYGGTGLSRQGVVDIVERLNKWGLLLKEGKPTLDGQEYTIGADPDWELIISDHSESKKGNKARGEKLRAAKANKASQQTDSQSMPQTSSLSDRPVVYETDHSQSMPQTDSQSMPQTHTNTQSNPLENTQKNTATSAAIIDTWLKVQSAVKPKAFKVASNHEIARALMAQGINCEDITGYIRWRRSDDFWNKFLSLEHIAENILVWKKKHAPKFAPPVTTIEDTSDYVDVPDGFWEGMLK